MSEQDKVIPGKKAPGTGATPPQSATPGNGSTAAGPGGSATAPAKPGKKRKSAPAPRKNPPGMLPPWKVLLHNDDVNDITDVVNAIIQLVHLNEQDAKLRTDEAHETGVSLLIVTHKERAELYREQFASKSMTVTIEPAE